MMRISRFAFSFLKSLERLATMWNIVIGIVFIVGGLTGQLALRGTQSGEALAVLGGVLVIWGGVQMVRNRNSETVEEENTAETAEEE